MTRRLIRAITLLAVTVAVVLPLGRLLLSLLAEPHAFATLWEPVERVAALNTALLALGSTAMALALGVPLGVLIGRADLPGAARWRTLATLPYIVPPYVSAIAWIALLNPTTGWLNAPLRALGLPTLDIYGLGGMVWVMGLEGTPLVMLATADALSRMDASLEEQARVSGATPWQLVRRVTLPIAAPAIVAAASVVLTGAAAAFGVPYLLASGTADPDWVLTTRIANHLDLAPSTGRPPAVALSLVLLCGAVVVPLAAQAWMRRRAFTTVGGKATRKAPLDLGRWRFPARCAVASFVVVGALLPLATLVLMSLTDVPGRLPSWSNVSVDPYLEVLARGRDRLAIGRSLVLAAGAATAAVGLGAMVAVLEARKTSGFRWLDTLARLPYTVPGTVLALGLLLTWSQEIRLIVAEQVTFVLALGDSAMLLGLAYAVKFLALPTSSVSAALQGFDPALEEASRVHGAGFLRTLRRVTLPLLLPTMAASWFLVFLPAFTEVTMSVLLAGPRTRVVGVLLFELQTYGDPAGAAALAVVVTGVVIVGHALVARLTGGRSG